MSSLPTMPLVSHMSHVGLWTILFKLKDYLVDNSHSDIYAITHALCISELNIKPCNFLKLQFAIFFDKPKFLSVLIKCPL